jgi:hypothetical protein
MHPDVRRDLARPGQLDHVHGRRVAALPALSAFQRGFGTLAGVFGVDLRRATRPRCDVPSSVQDFVERHEEDHRRQLTLRLV